VKSTNTAGDSVCSASASATTFPTVPSAPTGFTATAVSTSKIDLSWNVSAGANGYKIYQDATCSTLLVAIGNVVTYPHTGLTPGSLHHYSIKATNIGGDSGCAGPASATTFDNPPTTPTGLLATVISASEIDLIWDVISGATSYTLYSDDNCGTELTSLTSNSYPHSGLLPATLHTYTLKASGPGGLSVCSAPASATTESDPDETTQVEQSSTNSSRGGLQISSSTGCGVVTHGAVSATDVSILLGLLGILAVLVLSLRSRSIFWEER
jgi:hypothetical protein